MADVRCGCHRERVTDRSAIEGEITTGEARGATDLAPVSAQTMDGRPRVDPPTHRSAQVVPTIARVISLRDDDVVEPTYDVVWPSSPRGISTQRLAHRLDDLAGKRVAFLWDHLFRGDEVFPALAEHLRSRFDDIEIIDHAEFGNTHGGDEKAMIAGLPEGLAQRHVDAVVSAMGC